MYLDSVAPAELKLLVKRAEGLTMKACSSSTMMDWFTVYSEEGNYIGRIGRMDNAWFSNPGREFKTRYDINASIEALIYLLCPEAKEDEEDEGEVFEMSL
jgi:hypothetical protein